MTIDAEREKQAWEEAGKVKKSDFALEYALTEKAWTIPRYISEGLAWLAEDGTSQPLGTEAGTAGATP